MEHSPEFVFNKPLREKEAVAQLTGIAGSLIYDGKIDVSEFNFLVNWLNDNIEFTEHYPLSHLYTLIKKVISDNVLTQDDLHEIYNFLSNIGSLKVLNPTIEGIYDTDAIISFKLKTFLFTGELSWGSREKAMNAITNLGGIPSSSKSVTKKIDYLVVGDLGSDSWKHSRFGRKIQEAIDLRDGGHEIYIIREEQFVEAILSMKR